MPLILDLEQNALFKRGLEKGLKKGLKRELEKQRISAIKMLRKNMPIAEIADILDVEADYIIAIQKELNEE